MFFVYKLNRLCYILIRIGEFYEKEKFSFNIHSGIGWNVFT